jgi:hypothetical protein
LRAARRAGLCNTHRRMTGGSEGTAPERIADARPVDSADASLPVAARLKASDRRRTIRLSLAIFAVTFLIYFLLGPGQTPYDFQVSQANNMLHGHVDMTVEYTNNINLVERALYDGQGFCEPIDDPRGPDFAKLVDNPRYSADCREYMVHGFGPSILLMPLVAIFGLSLNQALISALVGGAAAVIVFAIARRYSSDLRTQLAMVVLAMFGTTMWYSSTDGGAWQFAQAVAAFFLFASIYATVAWRSMLLAAAFIGLAFLSRPTTIMAIFFPLVALSETWFTADTGRQLWRRLKLRPLFALALGLAPFLVVWAIVNYLRFGSPFETGYTYIEEFHQRAGVYLWPPFSVSYISRHIPVFFEATPIFSTQGSYVYPSYGGTALWITSPALLMGLFAHLKRSRLLTIAATLALAVAGAIILVVGAADRLNLTSTTIDSLPFGVQLLPFWLVIGAAIVFSITRRDRLVFACWAAIIPLTLVNWMFTGTGWAQFGYRFALDFIPFLWLLVVIAVPRLRWYHAVLIGASVLVNLWGVLWLYKFGPMQLFGWTWTGF